MVELPDFPKLESIEFPMGAAAQKAARRAQWLYVAGNIFILAVAVALPVAVMINSQRPIDRYLWPGILFLFDIVVLRWLVTAIKSDYAWRTDSNGFYVRSLVRELNIAWQGIESVSVKGKWLNCVYTFVTDRQSIKVSIPPNAELIASIRMHLERVGKADGIPVLRDVELWRQAVRQAQAQIEADPYIIRCATYLMSPDEKIMVNHPDHPRLITMDPLPQQVFLASNGTHRVSEIVDQLGGAFPSESPDELATQVQNEILNLWSRRLIKLCSEPTKLPYYLSAPRDTLDADKARKLMREDGFIGFPQEAKDDDDHEHPRHRSSGPGEISQRGIGVVFLVIGLSLTGVGIVYPVVSVARGAERVGVSKGVVFAVISLLFGLTYTILGDTAGRLFGHFVPGKTRLTTLGWMFFIVLAGAGLLVYFCLRSFVR